MKQVVVLMSTYNGDKYLEEQINSLINQEQVDIRILVRDDGSTDDTHKILEKYHNKGVLDWYAGKNIGWRKSFMELLYHAPIADYYAFCDQDDIWLPNKLHSAINAIESENLPNTPILYGSNLFIYKNGITSSKLNLNVKYTKQSALIRALTCGCTLVFNKSLYTLLKQHKPLYIEAHDSWVYIVAIYLGKVILDSNAYILYRQHDSNQIGAKKSFKDRLIRGYNNLIRTKKNKSKREAAEEFLRVYNSYLSEEDKIIISKFSNYNKGIIYKIKLLLDNRYTTGNFLSDIFLKYKIITNRI